MLMATSLRSADVFGVNMVSFIPTHPIWTNGKNNYLKNAKCSTGVRFNNNFMNKQTTEGLYCSNKSLILQPDLWNNNQAAVLTTVKYCHVLEVYLTWHR